MSFGRAYKLALALEKLKIESEEVSSVPVESLVLADEPVSVAEVKKKKQTGGIISARNFPSH